MTKIPASSETSVAAVANYIKTHESDPYQQIKAAHDWIADRIAYDAPLLDRHWRTWPPMKAGPVFKRRSGVCSGYAYLLRDFGKKLGHEVVYVTGDSRDMDGNVGGAGHAWNAVKIEDSWYLIDATWNAGYVKNGQFQKEFGTRYFMTPPEIFGMDHFPDKQQWQLRRNPISRGEFMRQPLLRPVFYAYNMRLIEPNRSQVTVGNSITVRLNNPGMAFVLGEYQSVNAKGRSGRNRCNVERGAETRITCQFHQPGSYRVRMFFNEERSGSYEFAGQILVNSQ